MVEGPAQLDYGRRPRARRLLWRVFALTAALVVVAVGYQWGPALKHQAGVLLDQRRCMAYRAPAYQVVYDTPRDEHGLRGKVEKSYAPPCWSRFTAQLTSPAVVFLHARTSPSGNLRLVCIEANPTLVYSVVGPTIRPFWSFRILAPDRWNGPADLPVPSYDDPFFIIGAERIYAGQPDPSDSSRFTLVYESGGERKTVDGWLQDDDTLKFRHRSSEAAE